MNLQQAKQLIKDHPGQFYTYLLKRPDGIPFYIGKGNCKGFRIEAHESDSLAHRDVNKYKENIVRKILRSGNQIDYDIVLFTDLEKQAFDKERELISFYGRRDQGGILANMTDGGEGTFGLLWSEESRKKFSEMSKGKIISDNQKIKQSKLMKGKPAWNKGIPMSIAAKEKLSQIKISEETRKRLSDSHKGRPAWNKGIPASPEEKLRLYNLTKGRIQSKEEIIKRVQVNTGKKRSEESKRKMSEAAKGKIISAAQRKKISDSLKGRHLSMECREKISLALKGKIPWNKGGNLNARQDHSR
ncbi:MAG: GIY-YIG nuclease family protein [Candidatus Omnitrophica bacterium]|jgi:hypothetical protein|nr:GIY-YIG nuclease family protein [Candidatus Omnitrophota bacterium]